MHVGMDGKVMYWDAYTGQPIRELEGGAAKLSITMHPGGTAFACGDAAGHVQLWRYDEGDCIAAGQQHTGGVGRCAFSPDGKLLASVDAHGAMMLWDMGSINNMSPGGMQNQMCNPQDMIVGTGKCKEP